MRFLCVAQRIGRTECLWAGFLELCERCGARTVEVRAAGDVRLWYTRRIAQRPRAQRAAIIDWRDQQEDGSVSPRRRAEIVAALGAFPLDRARAWPFRGVVMRMFVTLTA